MDALKKIVSLFLLMMSCTIVAAQAVVYVSTAQQLQTALNNAVPGQKIMIADGYYERSGGFYASAGIHGTVSNPITVIGSRNAILSTGNLSSGYGFSLKGNDHWVIKGFSVRVCKDGVMLDRSRYVVVDSLDIRRTGNSGIHLRTHTSYSIIKNCFIDSAGLENPSFGEGVYIGSAYSNWCTYTDCDPDTSNYNQVLNNVFGADIAAENIDIKEGTKGGLIKGNTFNGAGLQNMNGGDSWVDVKGNYYLIDSNLGNNTILDGYQTHIQQPGGYGNFNRFINNTINMNAAGYGVRVQTSNANGTAYGNEVCNNNTLSGTAAGLANVSVTSCSTLLSIVIFEWNVFVKNNDFVFSWKVSSAADIASFDIQRSVDGSGFSSLMPVQVNGVSYKKDTLLSAVKDRFFRLAIKMKGGQVSYSKIFRVADSSGSFKAMIEKDRLVILYPGEEASLRILNVQGQTVAVKKLQQGFNSISLANTSDFYILNVIDNKQGAAFTQKLSRYGH